MSKIKRETVEEFIIAVKLEYGKGLEFDDAEEILTGLAEYFFLLERLDAKRRDQGRGVRR